MATDFSDICSILGKLYFFYQDDENFTEFLEFNDLGLPLAYLASEGLCEVSDDGKRYIAETWQMLLVALELEDEGFTDLEQMLDSKKE